MPMAPREFDRRYGELDQVIRAYTGQPADDTPERRSAALTAYLRHTWRYRPWALATAETQVREYARNPPGTLRIRLGEFYGMPDVRVPGDDVRAWLLVIADHIGRSLEQGDAPRPESPVTYWEWHARFPELAQFLGGWFSQDMPDEFEDHTAAILDYLDSTDPQLVAGLVGEVHELLALPLDDPDGSVALAYLGMEVDPPAPHGPRGWLRVTADALASGTGR
ncbi:contact-dependent growth inhibition system immunity protein [Streptomyces sp. NPDC127068]|uniref:contact-dependent growth inhibition system immunity protein n=1 Tax=Streptomyces sp. NPDC127068 TaxID=3347127 RepID=UPI003652698E